MASDRRKLESVKFTFNEEQMRELGQQLARENQSVYDQEKRKKEVDAELVAGIKSAYGRAELLTVKINNGYEMREVEVLHLYDEPRSGMKRVIRADTSELIREEPMTFEEKQGGLGF